MKPNLTLHLGQRVFVHVDRPLGSEHPRYLQSGVYPINYGFLPGTRSGDGHPIDAYVLGIDEPVQQAEGIVIAIVVRADDVEDKLVVAADGNSYSEDQIRAQVGFQERFFDSTILTLNGRLR